MNDYMSIADLYDLYVTDTCDHPFWTRRAEEASGPILELTGWSLRPRGDSLQLARRSDRGGAAPGGAAAAAPGALAGRPSGGHPHNPSRRRLTLDGEARTLGPFAAADRRLEVQVSPFASEASPFILAVLEPAHT